MCQKLDAILCQDDCNVILRSALHRSVVPPGFFYLVERLSVTLFKQTFLFEAFLLIATSVNEEAVKELLSNQVTRMPVVLSAVLLYSILHVAHDLAETRKGTQIHYATAMSVARII